MSAIYARVSSKRQDLRSQLPDLKRWADAQGEPVKWYQDKATGRNMARPGWQKLASDLAAGRIGRLTVWRLDRLGRNAAGLLVLFDELRDRRVRLLSLTEGFDLGTPAGKLLAGVLASVAQYENELKGERVRAGQAAAKAAGKTWGGSLPGRRKKVTPVQAKATRAMKADGTPVTAIARAFSLSRPTIYSVLADGNGVVSGSNGRQRKV